MKPTKILTILVLVLRIMICSSKVRGQTPIGADFTFQGCLEDLPLRISRAADGKHDFEFAFFDLESNVNQIGDSIKYPRSETAKLTKNWQAFKIDLKWQTSSTLSVASAGQIIGILIPMRSHSIWMIFGLSKNKQVLIESALRN